MSFVHRHTARCCGCQATSIGASAARPFALPGTARHFERDRPFRVLRTRLDWTVDLDAGSVAGSATLSLERISGAATEIALDAVAFTGEDGGAIAVTVDGKNAPHRYDGKQLFVVVGTGATPTVVVRYSAHPRRGMYFLRPDPEVPNRPKQVWTQFQEEDARHCFPCVDAPFEKMATEVSVTIKNGGNDVYALSNGALIQRAGTKELPKFHWKLDAPHPSYLVTLVIGEFARLEAKQGKLPLHYLVPKGREKDAEYTFRRTGEMIALFEKLLGTPFPWGSYSQVVVSDFIFGGMENTTATTLYEHTLLDERARVDITSEDLIVHELAHQWFGDFVTCRSWSEGWLNEGFATYSEHLWRRHTEGLDAYQYGLRSDLDAYVGEARGRYRRAIVCRDYDAPLDLFDRHLYEKGGLFLHTLREEIGEKAFFDGLHLYLKSHANGSVETRDLQHALESVSGRGLGRLFEEGVHTPGHVELDVDLSWEPAPGASRAGDGPGVVVAKVRQTQAIADGVPGVFHAKLPFHIVSGSGATTEASIVLDARTDVFRFAVDSRPKFVVVDPNFHVLGTIHTKAPGDWLEHQMAHGATARERWLAIHAVAGKDDRPILDALAARLRDAKEFFGVRVEAADALARSKSPYAEEILRELLTKPLHKEATHAAKVRRAIVAGLGNFRTATAAQALLPIARTDGSYLVEAAAARALGRTKQAVAFEALLDARRKHSWADVIASAAIDGLAALADDRATPHLEASTRYGVPTRVRRAAILALPKFAGKKTRELLEELLDDSDPHLRIDVVRALVDLGDGKARGALVSRRERDLDPRVRRRIREALRDLDATAPAKKDDASAKEEVEELRLRTKQLESRLLELEKRFPPIVEKPAKSATRAETATPKSATKAKAAGKKKS
jgi:aminopeptidase N